MLGVERGQVAIFGAALASHIACLWAGFIWLDHAHIEDGLALAGSTGWGALFTHGFAGTGYYRPLMSASLSLDAALGGAAWLYHLTTLLWHAAASLLVAAAAMQLGISRRAGQAAALVFAVHPLTGVVANAIAFRSEAMVAASLLSLIILHRRGVAWASALVLCAGALTKETALVLGPLFVLSLELFHEPRALRVPSTRLVLLAAEAGGWLVAFGLRWRFAPSWRAVFPALSAEQALGTRLAAFTKSVRVALIPDDIGVCEAFPITPIATLSAVLGLSALLLLGYWAYRRRGPAMLLALSLLPSLQLVPVMRWWSPHYLYFPLAFAAMLLAEGAEHWGEQKLRWFAPLALALGGLSLLDSRRYANDQQFWSKEEKLEPACREAQFYLAESALASKRLDDAVAHYERAIHDTPGILSYVDLKASIQNLGVARFEQGRYAEAARAFRTVLGDAGSLDERTRRQLTHNLQLAEQLARRAGADVRELSPRDEN